MSLDDLERVARLRIIGSPPHDLQHLGTLERVRYVGTIGRINRLGTIATIGTVLLTVHAGTIDQVRRVGTQKYLGTVNRLGGGRLGTIGRLGTQAYLGTVNRVAYVPRLGTIGRLGTAPYLGTVNRLGGGRLGTLGRLGTASYLGSLNRLAGGRLGSIGYLGTVQRVVSMGTVPTDAHAVRYLGTVIRNAVPLGNGTTWVGSWQHVGSYRSWRYTIISRGGGGSFALLGGAHGTEGALSGTIYGNDQVMGSVADQLPPMLGQRLVRWTRPIFRRTGATRGTVSILLGKQP